MWKFIKEYVPSLLIAVIISLTVRTYIVEAVYIPSGSMIPTLQINDYLLIEKVTNPHNYQYGDIIVFNPPDHQGSQEEERYIKRLIGKEGDTIQVKDGALYRNGQKVDEPYIKDKMDYDFGPVIVPKDKLLVLGDNRNNSFDSHKWKTPFVDDKEVYGKAILRIYPLNQIRKF